LKWYCEGYALGIYEPDHLAQKGIDAVNTYAGFKVQLRYPSVCMTYMTRRVTAERRFFATGSGCPVSQFQARRVLSEKRGQYRKGEAGG
jgi:hypothetical protein